MRAPEWVRRRPTTVLLTAFVTLTLTTTLLVLLWPRPEPGPIVLLGRGSVGESRWAVLAEHLGFGGACLELRVDGARRQRMCDWRWDAPFGAVNLWHGEPPAQPVERYGPPSLLRVTFAGSDQVLVVSVVPEEVALLSLPGPAGGPETRLPVRRLLGSDQAYVLAVVPKTHLGEPAAFDDAGEPLFYRFLNQ